METKEYYSKEQMIEYGAECAKIGIELVTREEKNIDFIKLLPPPATLTLPSLPNEVELEQVDEILARLEDYTHGKDGEDVTKARKSISVIALRLAEAEKEKKEIQEITGCKELVDFKEKEVFYQSLIQINVKLGIENKKLTSQANEGAEEYYSKEQMFEFTQVMRHKCQIERNKKSKHINGIWYVACDDILKEDLPPLPIAYLTLSNKEAEDYWDKYHVINDDGSVDIEVMIKSNFLKAMHEFDLSQQRENYKQGYADGQADYQDQVNSQNKTK